MSVIFRLTNAFNNFILNTVIKNCYVNILTEGIILQFQVHVVKCDTNIIKIT